MGVSGRMLGGRGLVWRFDLVVGGVGGVIFGGGRDMGLMCAR